MAGGTLAPPTAVHWATKGALIGSGHTEGRPASERGGIPYVKGFSVQEGPNIGTVQPETLGPTFVRNGHLSRTFRYKISRTWPRTA